MKYEVVEIGVADFAIESEKHYGSNCLLVEPHPEHWQTLLDKKMPGWNVVNAAVTGFNDGTVDFFYVPSKYCDAGYGPRGQGSIGGPNPTFLPGGYWHALGKYLVKEKVSLISFSALVEKANIEAIELLKIDTEGHDGIIILGYADCCKKQPDLKAKVVIFESNGLMPMQQHAAAVKVLQEIGYTVRRLDAENMIAELLRG